MTFAKGWRERRAAALSKNEPEHERIDRRATERTLNAQSVVRTARTKAGEKRKALADAQAIAESRRQDLINYRRDKGARADAQKVIILERGIAISDETVEQLRDELAEADKYVTQAAAEAAQIESESPLIAWREHKALIDADHARALDYLQDAIAALGPEPDQSKAKKAAA